MKSVSNNHDFLFLYEAIQSNPNGDPDQENKPRMDYDTQTNLVSDVRLKRYVRDWLADNGHEIFVSLQDDKNVSMDERLRHFLESIPADNDLYNEIFTESDEFRQQFDKIIETKKAKFTNELLKDKSDYKPLNLFLLQWFVKKKWIDIRMFGSAFAVKGFNHAYTGPIQINWGYSLHPVELLNNTVSSKMNDDSGTFGKDYRVHYSLIGFTGTINARAARHTGLGEDDVQLFNDALWSSIPESPTRSKGNQYPLALVDITYAEGHPNGYFRDLRRLIDFKPVDNKAEAEIRRLEDGRLDFSKLKKALEEAKSKGVITEFKVRTASGIEF